MAGANPTTAQAFAQLALALDIVEERFAHGSTNTPNIYTKYDALMVALDGEYTPAMISVLNADRAAAAQLLSASSLQGLWEPTILESLRAEGLQLDGSWGERVRRFIREMNDDSQLWLSRNMTFGTPTFTTASTGTGNIRRCTVDRYGNDLECTGAEAKRARVVRDQTSGARKHREVFEMKGAAPARDLLDWTGSGNFAPLTAVDATSGGIIRNPSFEQGAVTDNVNFTSTTAMTGWTISDVTLFTPRSNATYVYRGYFGEPSTLWGLECQAGSGTITQTILTNNPSASFDTDVPWVCEIAWKRLASATGTLKLKLGSVEATVDVSTGVNGTWNKLVFATGQNQWYRQWGNAGSVQLVITTDTIATGTVAIDDLVVAPMTCVDGTFAAAVGSDTSWLNDDEATYTDSQGTTTTQSYWFWRTFLNANGGPNISALRSIGHSWLPTTTTASNVTIAD